MFEQSRWLPPVSQTTTLSGNPLPLMPSKVLKATFRYGPVLGFDLNPSEKNSQQVKDDDANGVKVEIIRPLSIGYGNVTQIVLARVLEGQEEIKGKKVVLQFFDPLYVTPEWLTPIIIAGTVIVTFQIYADNIERPESSSSTVSTSLSDSYSATAARTQEIAEMTESMEKLNTETPVDNKSGWGGEVSTMDFPGVLPYYSLANIAGICQLYPRP
jgi:hypothetical protein